MKRIHSRKGVQVYQRKDGTQVVTITYTFNGVAYYEQVGESERRRGREVTRNRAERLLEKRRYEMREAKRAGSLDWLPPHKREKRTATTKAKQRGDELNFDAQALAYLDRHARDYARPEEYRSRFHALAHLFSGRRLDSITRAEIRQYHHDRWHNEGGFAAWPHKGDSPRPGELEITALSGLYTWLIDDQGHDHLDNPCLGYQPRSKSRAKVLRYKPQHKPIIPDAEEMAAIVAGAQAQGPKALAFVLGLWYTAARPESELCQLRHGDVVLSSDDGEMGRLTFRDTKTGGDRTVPLHLGLEPALLAIMVPKPSDPADYEAWAALPLFAKRGRPTVPWDRYSYRKLWTGVLSHNSEKHPLLLGMWPRDLRKASITAMRAAGVDSAIAAKVAGHSTEMNDFYTQATAQSHREAILQLGLSCGPGIVDRPTVPGPAEVQ